MPCIMQACLCVFQAVKSIRLIQKEKVINILFFLSNAAFRNSRVIFRMCRYETGGHLLYLTHHKLSGLSNLWARSFKWCVLILYAEAFGCRKHILCFYQYTKHSVRSNQIKLDFEQFMWRDCVTWSIPLFKTHN